MDIELPPDQKQDESISDRRIDDYEAYWLYVDGVRYVKPVLEQSDATEGDTDQSPLARHFNHFYEKKEEYKDKCRDLPGNLPQYKEQFREPRGDVRQIPNQELDDLGIEHSKGDDPIWLPPEYNLPKVWDDNFDDMDAEELREVIHRLQEQNTELRDERNKLKEQLQRVRRSLTQYLDTNYTDETGQAEASAYTCDKCEETFDSRAARNGHKAHCEGTGSQKRQDNSKGKTKTSRNDLASLAEELPEIQKQQSNWPHEGLSPEEELENLNHLLQGCL